MSVVILIGAGASKALGYPTTVEFYQENLLVNSNLSEVYNKLKNFFRQNKLDVEDVLSLLDPINDFKETKSGEFLQTFNKVYFEYIHSFIEYSQNRCFDLYGRKPDYKEFEKLYLPFLDACGWKVQKVELFTTNYDPVSDLIMDLADELKLKSFDGFNNRSKWDYRQYGYDSKKTLAENGINIYRLHGSMSWFKDGKTIKNTRDYNRRQNIGTKEHLLIYPGYKGNPHIDNKDTDAYTFPSNQFERKIFEYEYLIVVGFSFRDEHINEQVKKAMDNNQKLNLIILNPIWESGLNQIVDKIKEIYPSRVKHIENKFGDREAIIELKKCFSK